MAKYDKFYEVQNFYIDLLNKELVGPVENEEIIDVFPLQTYVSGILWAQRKAVEKEQVVLNDSKSDEILQNKEEQLPVDNLLVGDIDDEINVDSLNTNAIRKPSTMGVTCILADNEKKVHVKFKYAKYVHSEKERIYGNENKKVIDNLWTRNEYVLDVLFDLTINKTTYRGDVTNVTLNGEVVEDCKHLNIIATNRSKKGDRLFTFTAVNLAIAPNKDIIQNESALFQCEMEIRSEYGFVAIGKTYHDKNIENLILDMQYSESKTYAQGHGCSAHRVDSGTIKTSFVPLVMVHQMKSLNYSDKDLFNLNYLETATKNDIIVKMNAFIDSYVDFKESQKNMVIDSIYSDALNSVVDKIGVCITRLKKGVETLEVNEKAWSAFVLSNSAMLEQRISMELKKGAIKTRESYDRKLAFWYPFQLFYLVMIIPDIVDNNSKYNDKVDLLYFPTGGGKTEAYLAVSAFVIFYERINSRNVQHGVSIIMRYTLRLLTMQQFERATALICACEKLRIEKDLGGNKISIGLWIGNESTPNKLVDAIEILEKERNGEYTSLKGNPVQITFCPNCGAKLNAMHYVVEEDGLHIRCPNGCFSGKLPIYVIDEDVYRNKPTLLLSTVDKFARIVWDEKTSVIFGNNDMPAPRLIIQDELHLISGPLGSLTGIYESAIDFLCSKKGVTPKIIASTATLKNSKEQIKNLFGRDVVQFPPSGVSYKSSYFAEIANKNERPCRTYIGVTELGGSMLDLFLRVLSINTLASYVLQFKESVDVSVLDNYYTTVGYFNALRELGTSSTAIKERMVTYMNFLLNTKFKKLCEDVSVPAYKYEAGSNSASSENAFKEKFMFNYMGDNKHAKELYSAELTSRRSTKEIREMLDLLSYSLKDKTETTEDDVYNYVLSSNMFSVGVDIDRLGSMFVYGQPKSNSEYIQSTSRVGRANPGMVFTAYNAFRSRDKSFYENFYDYHNNFYKYVEATSLTPFSLRSIEKALHSVFIALIRHTVLECSNNDGASKFNKNREYVDKIKEYILERVKNIEPSVKGFAEEYLDFFIDYWHDNADDGNGKLVYDKIKLGNKKEQYEGLLKSADEEDDVLFKTLNSVRNVDAVVNVFVEGTKK